jgi:uncharacterized protein (DUF305 family)
MSKRTTSRRAAIAAALTAAAVVTAPAVSAKASQPASNPTTAQRERSFLTETIDHHYMGVRMGRLCVDKARSRRLGDICTAIVVNQAAEIVRMRDDFLLDWYGVEKHPALTPTDRRDLNRLRRRRGRAFDVALARMFIEHHQMQVSRSQGCVSQAEHHELRHVCMDQIDTQSAEIGQFRRVLRSYRR